MTRSELERRVITAVQAGLPLVARPFAALAAAAGVPEDEFRGTVAKLVDAGVIKRFGLVVHHRPLGYRANAMVVWDVPDGAVGAAADAITAHDFVTLCYRRPRRPPAWPYNLFCMIHGRDRDTVLDQISELARLPALRGVQLDVLFSTRRFKQRGARYLGDSNGNGTAKVVSPAATVTVSSGDARAATEGRAWST